MSKLLLRLPWFAAAPAIVLAAAIIGFIGYSFVGDYFVQTCENEVNLLTGEIEGSCGGDDSGDGGGDGGAAVAQPTTAASGAVVTRGTFQDGDPGHNGKGTAEIQKLADGRLNLRLADFSVTNGPDLFVYLSPNADGDPGEFVNLGKLTANNGNQNYTIPAGTDIAKYRRVIIWCRQFRVNFAFASLEQPRAAATLPPAAQAQQPAATPTAASASPVAATSTLATGSTSNASPTATPAANVTTTPANPPPSPTATAVPPTAAPATPTPATAPGVVARGTFRDGAPGHNGSGVAEVQRLADGSLNLRLGNFSVTNGPDLIVYLSPSGDDYAGGGVNLGKLKANNGNQNYGIPAGTDLSQYRSVVIWCKSFPTVFAIATLEVQ